MSAHTAYEVILKIIDEMNAKYGRQALSISVFCVELPVFVLC